MIEMGMRELKENIGYFVNLLKKNQSVTLNYRGQPFAIVQAIGRKKLPKDIGDTLQKLERMALLTGGDGKLSTRFQPIPVGGKPISDYILESRE